MSVQVISYSNPSNRCAGCGGGGCCDDDDATSCAALCDNEFLYCLRPFSLPDQPLQALQATAEEIVFSARAAMLQCLEFPSAIRTDVDNNADATSPIFFNSTYLGIPNPILFEVESPQWEVSY